MDTVFNEKDVEKKVFDDRWVRFAFGSQGRMKTDNLNLGITEFSNEKTSLTHRHDVDEALYILSGRATVRLGDKSRKVAAGDFIYVPRQTNHTVITDLGSSIRILFIFSGKVSIDH